MDAQLKVARKLVLAGGVGDHGEVVVELLGKLREVANVIHAFVEAARELGRNGLDGDLLIAMAARMMSSSGGVCGESVSSWRLP